MNFAEAAMIRDLFDRVATLERGLAALEERLGEKNEIAGLRLRVGSLQAQINSIRRIELERIEPRAIPDAPANTSGQDAA